MVFSDVMSIDGTCYETICYLVDYFPQHDIWVVEQRGYEWVDWLLLNGTTGEYQRAISEPVLSPDGTRLLCSYRDVIAAFNFNGVEIWRVGPDSLVPEFNEKNVSWAPSNVAWDGDSTVRVNMITVDWEEWTGTVRPTYIELTPDGQWVPEDPELWWAALMVHPNKIRFGLHIHMYNGKLTIQGFEGICPDINQRSLPAHSTQSPGYWFFRRAFSA